MIYYGTNHPNTVDQDLADHLVYKDMIDYYIRNIIDPKMMVVNERAIHVVAMCQLRMGYYLHYYSRHQLHYWLQQTPSQIYAAVLNHTLPIVHWYWLHSTGHVIGKRFRLGLIFLVRSVETHYCYNLLRLMNRMISAVVLIRLMRP